jgi:hypothetical protein
VVGKRDKEGSLVGSTKVGLALPVAIVNRKDREERQVSESSVKTDFLGSTVCPIIL